MKAKNIFILALMAGAVTAAAFYLFINESSAGMAPEPVDMQEVVTAAEDVGQHVKITEEMLTTTEIPEEQVHPDMILDAASIVDRFTSAALKEGEVIMEHRLDAEGAVSEFISKKLEAGHRAVSISVDYVRSVSNMIEPEDFVDIVLTEEAAGDDPVTTELVLENVRVLAVGERLMEPDAEEEAGSDEYHAVTLELTPEDSLTVIHASERGTLQLALYSKLITEEEMIEEEELLEKEEANEEEANEEEANEETESEEDAEEAQQGKVVLPVAARSMIRTSPEMGSSILTAVDKDTPLEFLEEEETDSDGRVWYFVQTPEDQTGWISSRIATFEDEE